MPAVLVDGEQEEARSRLVYLKGKFLHVERAQEVVP